MQKKSFDIANFIIDIMYIFEEKNILWYKHTCFYIVLEIKTVQNVF